MKPYLLLPLVMMLTRVGVAQRLFVVDSTSKHFIFYKRLDAKGKETIPTANLNFHYSIPDTIETKANESIRCKWLRQGLVSLENPKIDYREAGCQLDGYNRRAGYWSVFPGGAKLSAIRHRRNSRVKRVVRQNNYSTLAEHTPSNPETGLAANPVTTLNYVCTDRSYLVYADLTFHDTVYIVKQGLQIDYRRALTMVCKREDDKRIVLLTNGAAGLKVPLRASRYEKRAIKRAQLVRAGIWQDYTRGFAVTPFFIDTVAPEKRYTHLVTTQTHKVIPSQPGKGSQDTGFIKWFRERSVAFKITLKVFLVVFVIVLTCWILVMIFKAMKNSSYFKTLHPNDITIFGIILQTGILGLEGLVGIVWALH